MILNNRHDRFITNSSSKLNAEWQVSGNDVIQQSRNYQNRLSRVASRISRESILETILNLYIKHDIKKAIQNESEYNKIEELFRTARNENSVDKIIRAYTLNGPFFTILNRHLAIVMSVRDLNQVTMNSRVHMSYWQGPLDFATLLVTDLYLEQFRYNDKQTYRGVCMSNDEFLFYQNIGTKFLNKTFLSTSKCREVAEVFSGGDASSHDRQPENKCCLFIFTFIKNNARRTALDIEQMSQFSEEKEVIILPYNTFEVTSCKPSTTTKDLMEIELQEVNSQ